jgi:Flp pilus assembly protein TadB
MAQTKRKRQTKHRGTAAGTVQSRGRTSRPASPEERKKLSRQAAREARLNTPPTWKASVRRAALASVLMFLFLLLLGSGRHSNRVVGALIFAVFAFALYVPGGYYVELFMFNRRQKQKAGQR